MTQVRKADYPIESNLLNRWSPRSMTGEPISEEELYSLFEAARWAPSCYNEQPWRFIYAKRDTEHWQRLYDLMIAFNQQWTAKAAVLIVVASHKVFERNQKPAQTHSYDTGAACQNLALEGFARGLVVHGMQGFDYKKAAIDLKIPAEYQVEAMIAIGKKAPRENLSPGLQEKEVPSQRKPIKELISEGIFSL